MAVTNKNNVIELTLAKKSRPVTVNVVSLETAVPYIFKLIDYTPDSGMTARIYIEKEDGHLVYNNCTISGNEITFTPTTQCFNVGKMATAQLQIMSGSKVALSYLIVFVIEENIINNSAIESSNEFTALQTLITSAEGYNGIIGANNATGYDDKTGWVELTSGQDLNSVLTPGIYVAKTGTIANSLLHYVSEPPNTPMRMFVTELGGLRKRQTIEFTLPKIRTYNRITYDGGNTWNDWIMEPEREIPGPKSEIYNIIRADNEGRIRFYYRSEYEGELTPAYGRLICRLSAPGFLTKVIEIGDPGVVDTPSSTPDGAFQFKDLGFGGYVRTYIKLGEEYIYDDQLYVRYDEL